MQIVSKARLESAYEPASEEFALIANYSEGPGTELPFLASHGRLIYEAWRVPAGIGLMANLASALLYARRRICGEVSCRRRRSEVLCGVNSDSITGATSITGGSQKKNEKQEIRDTENILFELPLVRWFHLCV